MFGVAQLIDDDMLSRHATQDPYAYFGHIRETDPVHWNGQFRMWLVTPYAEVIWGFRNHEAVSSEYETLSPEPPAIPFDPADTELAEQNRIRTSRSFIHHDRPRHFEERAVLQEYWAPRSMERWRPMVRVVVNELLDPLADKHRMDVVKDFASILPLHVILEVLGVPREDAPRLRELSIDVLSANTRAWDRFRRLEEARRALDTYFGDLIDARRARPGDDPISLLADAEGRGILSRAEVLADVQMLLVAGHETSISTIAGGVRAFMVHPDQWALLRRDIDGRVVSATEEVLRYEPAVKAFLRVAKDDLELSGKRIPKYDRILLVVSSANRDPAEFPNPDHFDITRGSTQHVAFGNGIHVCLGRPLARIEAQEALRAFAERFPHVRLEEAEPEYEPHLTLRRLTALPVAWD